MDDLDVVVVVVVVAVSLDDDHDDDDHSDDLDDSIECVHFVPFPVSNTMMKTEKKLIGLSVASFNGENLNSRLLYSSFCAMTIVYCLMS